MAIHPAAAAAAGANGHSLRFLNEDWNDSISNGSPFTLRWNQSLAEAGGQLGLFKISYPEDGVVVYDLVSNLTESMNSSSCTWTPEDLEKKLYAMWLTTGQHVHPNWTLSPPWTPKEHKNNRFHWAAPIVIPIVSFLAIYAVCLSIYLWHRRRKREKRAQEDATPHRDVTRNNSQDSAITVESIEVEDDGTARKPSVWLVTQGSQEREFTTSPTSLWKDDDTVVDSISRGRANSTSPRSPV